MSRDISPETQAAIFAPQTEEAFLILLTISHASLPAPLRVCNNAVDITSRGDIYIAFPFELSLPDDGDDRPPRARLAIDNVDRQIVQAVRSLDSSPAVLIEIVRAAAPDTVEARFEDFRFTNISYDSNLVEGDLTLEDFTSEPYPAAAFTPGLFPGLF